MGTAEVIRPPSEAVEQINERITPVATKVGVTVLRGTKQVSGDCHKFTPYRVSKANYRYALNVSRMEGYSMSKPTKKAPSTTATDNDIGDSSRSKNTKENKMHQFNKALFGVIYLILKISFIIAGVALVKMPLVHVIVDIPLYQVVGSIILLFLVYLELHAYFTKPADKRAKKTQPRTAIESITEGFIETPVK